MRSALIFATLIVGTLARCYLHGNSVSLPDFEFTVSGLPEKHVKFYGGKVEGLRDVLRRHPSCWGPSECDVTVSGLRFTYKAVRAESYKEFDVVVDVLHGLLTVDEGKDEEGKYKVNDVKVRTLHQYVREPVEFSSDREQNALFDEQLKEETVKQLKQLTQSEEFEWALQNAPRGY